MTHYIPTLIATVIVYAWIDRSLCNPRRGPHPLLQHLAVIALAKVSATALGAWILQPNVRTSTLVGSALIAIALDTITHTKPWLPLIRSMKRLRRIRAAHTHD